MAKTSLIVFGSLLIAFAFIACDTADDTNIVSIAVPDTSQDDERSVLGFENVDIGACVKDFNDNLHHKRGHATKSELVSNSVRSWRNQAQRRVSVLFAARREVNRNACKCSVPKVS